MPTHLNLPGGTTWASALLMVTWAWHSFLSILRLKCVVRVLWSLMISGRYCKALRRGSCRWKDIYFSTKSMVMRLKREARSQNIKWCLLCHICRIAIIYLLKKRMKQWVQCLCIRHWGKGSAQILQGDSCSERPQCLCHGWFSLALLINC